MIRIYKKICLVCFNLKKMYKDNKMLFLLVILSTMISTFGIFFFASYLADYVQSFTKQTGDMLIIEQEFSDNSGNEVLKGILSLNTEEIEVIVCKQENISEDENSNIMGEYHKNYSSRMHSGRVFEINETNPYVIIDEFQALNMDIKDTPINEKIEINGKEYQVAGVCTITEYGEIIVPVGYFLKNCVVNQIEITFSNSFSKEKRKEIEKVLIQYGVEEINWKAPEVPFNSTEFWVNFLQVLAIFIVIGINILVLIHYLLYRNKKNYSIYAICGGNDIEIFLVIFLQVFIHLLLGTVLGVIGTLLFFRGMGNVDWLYQGSVSFYFIVFGIIVLVYVIAACILERKINGNREIYQIEE